MSRDEWIVLAGRVPLFESHDTTHSHFTYFNTGFARSLDRDYLIQGTPPPGGSGSISGSVGGWAVANRLAPLASSMCHLGFTAPHHQYFAVCVLTCPILSELVASLVIYYQTPDEQTPRGRRLKVEQTGAGATVVACPSANYALSNS